MKLRLAELREGKLSQGQIAKIANVSLKTEWNWENGKTFPNAEQVFAICTALGCTPNDLLYESERHRFESCTPHQLKQQVERGFYCALPLCMYIFVCHRVPTPKIALFYDE